MTLEAEERQSARTEPETPVPAVQLERVTKRFGEVVAVDSIFLDVKAGEFFALLGPSGCGKTTTLRLIGGFEEPTQGTIRLYGRDVTDLKAYRRPVNTVFQHYALFPHLNVFENVAFGQRRQGVEAAELGRRVAQTLELVRLGGLERRKPRELSGGQQQRVALARALINRPRVLLLDEPLGALDLKLRKEMQLELKRIQHEVGITFIHVTHDQEEAMTMANRIAVMHQGRIERLGSPEEIYEDPRSTFVAGFLGASNLMQASVRDGAAGRVALVADGTELRVPPSRLGGQARQVQVGVRPEKIRLRAPDQPTPEPNVIRGVVTDASFVGVSIHYLVRTSFGLEMSVVVQNVEVARFRPEEQVLVAWAPEHTFVLDDR